MSEFNTQDKRSDDDFLEHVKGDLQRRYYKASRFYDGISADGTGMLLSITKTYLDVLEQQRKLPRRGPE